MPAKLTTGPAVNRASGRASGPDAMSVQLGSILDSFEKLEIVVFLHGRGDDRRDTRSIGRHLQLEPEVVVNTLADLVEANILCAPRGDDTGWWFDPDSPWATTIDVRCSREENDNCSSAG